MGVRAFYYWIHDSSYLITEENKSQKGTSEKWSFSFSGAHCVILMSQFLKINSLQICNIRFLTIHRGTLFKETMQR